MKTRQDKRQVENVMQLIENKAYGLAETYLNYYKEERGENRLYRQMKRTLREALRGEDGENNRDRTNK